MKSAHYILALALVSLTACKVIDNPNGTHRRHKPGSDGPETVMVTYHVLPGHEADFPALLSKAWGIYVKEHLVLPGPHVVVQTADGPGRTKFVEVLTWADHSAPNRSVATMQDIWGQEEAECEPRDGHQGLEGGEVQLVVP